MYFCTFFDSNYLNKGLSCYHSMVARNPSATLYVLCMDEGVRRAISALENAVPVSVADIEDYYPLVKKAKADRSPKEYCLTMKPLMPLYVFDRFSPDLLFYVDADMLFWSDPKEILDVMGAGSIMASDHELVPVYPAGRFNAGFLGYRNDGNCRAFLEWWRDRCIEWCRWFTIAPGKCGDQGYLNALHDTAMFSGFAPCPHPGINLGPWNIAKHNVTEQNGGLLVDGKYNLICYHYHEFRILDQNSYRATGWKHSDSDDRLIYKPYFELVKRFTRF